MRKFSNFVTYGTIPTLRVDLIMADTGQTMTVLVKGAKGRPLDSCRHGCSVGTCINTKSRCAYNHDKGTALSLTYAGA